MNGLYVDNHFHIISNFHVTIERMRSMFALILLAEFKMIKLDRNDFQANYC